MPKHLNRRIFAMPEALNDLGSETGLSPQLCFQDMTNAFCGPVTAPASLPTCHSIIVAVADPDEKRDTRLVPTTQSQPVATKDIMWFPQTVKHIPDVYALLHAVLNCHVQTPIEPDSVLDRLAVQSRNTTTQQRAVLIQEAAALQKAYVSTVVQSVWTKQIGMPGGLGEPARISATLDRYYVFVVSAATGKIVCIDNISGVPVEVDNVLNGFDVDTTVITAGIADKIRSIVASKKEDNVQAVVVGLVSRNA
ncbi:hypothetical protein CMQ_7202 [Grosmannia clavigera kw1407]|uniref:ubiquitinyl hydrolase 1 n=1 Tax=Grosmannia clavigera (strain kw1407 / UAMH 11150) TaxID=655863 RepID=F0XPJ7_GROCL|nr:uncharacterized protein CMQ_7202 [Grosmannia clavigera kw1407]EFX00200.1 hypothetical protein CMQ_7202 [Grosmannia clavigera kw1407]